MSALRLPLLAYATLMVASLPPLPVSAQVSVFTVDGTPGSTLGVSVAGVGDVDRDGHPDFAVGMPEWSLGTGQVRVYSGLSGAILHTFHGDPGISGNLGSSLAGAGDVDGDGHPDIIAGMATYSTPSLFVCGGARVYSGRTGAVLHTVLGDGNGDLHGTAVCSPGDVDRDGHADFLVGAPENGAPIGFYGAGYARLYSGREGTTLHTFYGQRVTNEYGARFAAVGDMNRDGYPDFAIGSLLESPPGGTAQGSARVYSGRDFSVLLAVFSESGGDHFSSALAGPGDLNGDGVPDLLVGAINLFSLLRRGMVRAFSGADGAILYTVRAAPTSKMFGMALTVLDDLDGDGVREFAVSDPADSARGSQTGAVYVHSGLHAAPLHSFYGPFGGASFGFSLGTIGDVTGDGLAEMIVGSPRLGSGQRAGRAHVLSLSDVALVGIGCGAPRPPRLEGSPARIGGTTTLDIGRAAAGQPGALLLSLPPRLPLPLGASCFACLDPASAVVAATLRTDPGGTWSGGLSVPPNPALVGAQIALQAVLAPTPGPLGFDTTNGLYLTVTN